MAYLPSGGLISTSNSTTTPINANVTYQGTWEDISNYASITIIANSSHASTLYVLFSTDGINIDRTVQLSSTSATDLGIHSLTPVAKYLAVKLINGSTNQTSLRIQTILNKNAKISFPTSRMAQTLGDYSDVLNSRSVLVGKTDGGYYENVPVTPEGHLEMALHDPLLPFGSIHTENLVPVFQSDAVYSVNPSLIETTTSNGGTVTANDSAFVCSSGTTTNAQAVLQSRKRLRYRPGQGTIIRFTAMFTNPVSYSYQIAGIGHSGDGFYFGYGNTNDLTDTRFGILYVNRGLREVRTLTITTASSTTENITVRLNGVNNTVAVTNSGNIQRTVWEISQGTYTGWKAYPSGASVVFVRTSAGTATAGTYTLTATSAAATGGFVQTRAGAASTDTFIPQSSWNGDVMDGTGLSGVTLNPQKFNLFQIGIQYLGAGDIEFKIRVGPSGNNSTWLTVHTIRNPNTLTATHVGNPSFPFTIAAYSAGSTTDLTVKCGSFAGFIEGQRYLHGPRGSYFNSITTVGATNYQCLLTILNPRYYNRVSQIVINLISVSGALKHTSPCIFYLIKNGSLAGNPSFTSYSSSLAGLSDTSATTVTVTDNSQILWTGHLGDTGDVDHHFGNGHEEFTLQPGEWITLAAKAVTGSPSYVTGSINTREDQ